MVLKPKIQPKIYDRAFKIDVLQSSQQVTVFWNWDKLHAAYDFPMFKKKLILAKTVELIEIKFWIEIRSHEEVIRYFLSGSGTSQHGLTLEQIYSSLRRIYNIHKHVCITCILAVTMWSFCICTDIDSTQMWQ